MKKSWYRAELHHIEKEISDLGEKFNRVLEYRAFSDLDAFCWAVDKIRKNIVEGGGSKNSVQCFVYRGKTCADDRRIGSFLFEYERREI